MESSSPTKRSDILKTSETEEEPSTKLLHSKYKDIISTLPRKSGLNNHYQLSQFQGFWFPSSALEGVISAQECFKARPTDIIISSAPKTGTTWLKALSFAIVTRSHFDDSTNPLLTTMPHTCVPFLENNLARNSSAPNPEFLLVATHIPYSSLPKSIIASGCKIVYICREPKDAFVSMWHFASKMKDEGMEPSSLEVVPLEEAVERFCEGVSGSGPYWDHVLGYWRMSLECPQRILFLKYENLKNETAFYVKRLAEFMGHPFSLEEERKGVVQKIVNLCSFENLGKLEVNKSGVLGGRGKLVVENKAFFRKGKVGDWENYLTPEMAARIDHITEQKLSGSGLNLHVPHKA